MAQPKKVNYLNNKDILKEIHKSKMSFCWLSDEQYFQHDIIVDDVKKFDGHIACSDTTRSELVIPCFGRDRKLLGVLDIDSDHPTFLQNKV